MGRCLRSALIATLMIGAIAVSLVPARSQPSGKTVTSEVAVGGAFAAYLLAYEAALVKSKGSRKQAETVMEAKTDTRAGGLSLNRMRGLIISVIARAPTAADERRLDNEKHEPVRTEFERWRTEFEDFRACWNASFALEGTTAETKLQSTDAKVQSQKAGLPTMPPDLKFRPPSCTDLIRDTFGGDVTGDELQAGLERLNKRLDLRDLGAALATPSLFSQIKNQEVGLRAVDNYLKARLLTIAAEHLAASVVGDRAAPVRRPVAARSAFAPSSVEDYFSKCFANVALPCMDFIAQGEAALQTSQKRRDACAWAREVWIPPYTLIRIWGGKIPNARAWMQPPVPLPAALPFTGNDADADVDALLRAPDLTPVEKIDFGNVPGC